MMVNIHDAFDHSASAACFDENLEEKPCIRQNRIPVSGRPPGGQHDLHVTQEESSGNNIPGLR